MAGLFQPPPPPATELGRFRVLSSSAGVRVSPLQLGAMSIGEAWKGFMGSMDKEQSFKLLDEFVACGGNFIDTANNYQDQESEEWLGEWMESRKNRDYIVMATKFTTLYNNGQEPKGRTVNHSGNHKRSLKLSLRDSLKKLRTDWIDILYVHWWDWTTSVKELMDSLDEVVKQGKVLYLGISDTPAYIVAAANTYAIENGKTPFSVYQGRWNVMVRDMEREIVPMCRHFGMAIAPWDALGGGKFQSKKSLEERKKNNESLRSMANNGGQTENEAKMSEALEKVGQEHGTDSVTAVALAYVMAKAPNVFPIIGGRKIEHLRGNIEALKIKLSEKQIEYLESIVPFEPGFPNNFVGLDPAIHGTTTNFSNNAAPMAWQKGTQPIAHE